MSKLTLLAIVASICIVSFVSVSGYGHGGHSSSHYSHHGHAYKFGYDITDPYGAKNSRKESDDGYGNRHGSYSIYDKDGRYRVVDYVAGKKGFQAKIRSNEPGVQSSHAAHASYHHDGHGYHGGHYGHGGYGHGHGHGHGGHGKYHHGGHY
ncbi:hypothetical protein RDWZM_003291 [Blomia tropicalis]|uniref:Uncharacterized protein n=1 Tax=Blomia tropicalis TaxID=40697 RepID=A0A9Q0MEY1_BLOTA|nr:hypothetical protein BLOT_000582 [Blomia tropicalis]KAJ6224746.1 hypothetical protein RDWZM_003291 [Blomia tropicalis]